MDREPTLYVGLSRDTWGAKANHPNLALIPRYTWEEWCHMWDKNIKVHNSTESPIHKANLDRASMYNVEDHTLNSFIPRGNDTHFTVVLLVRFGALAEIRAYQQNRDDLGYDSEPERALLRRRREARRRERQAALEQ
ncbi:hypothetical protein PIB30_022157 [Stylosanthes scabra]|uniref:Uncharacterized protein n=1 Tax=Stylosanthes scabra TaxID=79078 RepID=A0ABU6V786_9FABA|nr:hypothetical protein [Stylosanthes scabra]